MLAIVIRANCCLKKGKNMTKLTRFKAYDIRAGWKRSSMKIIARRIGCAYGEYFKTENHRARRRDSTSEALKPALAVTGRGRRRADTSWYVRHRRVFHFATFHLGGTAVILR